MLVAQLSWVAHDGVKTLMSTLSWIKRSAPRSGLLENVLGLDIASSQVGSENTKTPLAFILDELDQCGYSAFVMHLDLAEVHECSRKRSNRCAW